MAKLWREIGWVDVEAYLKKDDRAIVPVGSCEPGTISLSPDTFVAVMRDIVLSLYRHGFRRILNAKELDAWAEL